MARLEPRKYTYFTTVRGMCRNCRRVTPARIYFKDGAVWQQSVCPDCNSAPAKIAGDSEWYMRNVLQSFPDNSPLAGARAPKLGCPHDCGPCSWHATPCQLPVFSITNACDLRCPICFTYNRNDRMYHMTPHEMQECVDWIVQAAGRVDLINITGGEPTLHPNLMEILNVCRRPEIGRITMNSNGLRLADDTDLCDRLAELGVYVILSFNTFDPAVSLKLHGVDVVEKKLRAIDNLTRAGARMTLLNVLMRNTNEVAIGGILRLMRSNDSILNLTVQTMTYTGQGGGIWSKRDHIPVDEAARIVCDQSEGDLVFEDFISRPSAHPLCYLTSYLLKTGEKFLPFARIAPRERISALMMDGYLIRMENEPDFFREAIDRLYADGDRETIKHIRKIVEDIFALGRPLDVFERQRRAEAAVRTVYIHAHMDEDTFDCSRAALCPDQVPNGPGSMIPACAYNLFYRMKDDRFYGGA